MSIVFSGVSPHPPIMIPEIGKSEIAKCQKTCDGLAAFSTMLVESNPELLVLITPHGPVFRDAVSIYTTPSYSGDFRAFNAPEVQLQAQGYPALARQILETAKTEKIPAVELNESTYSKYGLSPLIDHAAMVPLYYFQKAGLQVPMVLISIGFLPYSELFQFGQCVQKAIARENKRTAVIASGDLSHRLIPAAPAGYNPRGKEFDQTMMDLLSKGNAREILNLNGNLIEQAGECGFRPIVIMLGAINSLSMKHHVLSYEGPFGVGYGVVAYTTDQEKSES